jgi:hypothetical protein
MMRMKQCANKIPSSKWGFLLEEDGAAYVLNTFEISDWESRMPSSLRGLAVVLYLALYCQP